MLLYKILQIQGYPLQKANEIFLENKLPDQNQLLQWQNDQRWHIVKYHHKNTPFYNSRVHKVPEAWESLPVLSKFDYQQPLPKLLSNEYQKKDVYISNTSGSSGHPFYFAKDKLSHAISYALIQDRYQWHGVGLDLKQARFYGIPLNGKSRIIEQMKDFAGNRVRFPVFDMSEDAMEQFLQRFKRTRFDYIYGYTSAIALFSRYLKGRGEVLKKSCPSLKACIVTSEVCTLEDRKLIETATGVKVLNEYGASELSIIAFPDLEGDWILSNETLDVEVLDVNNQPVPDGQEGKIVVTSLFNRAMPFIRYDIGDLGAIERGEKSRLLRLSGRTNDTIVLPSGKKAAGLTFYYISRSILEANGSLKEFIIRQTALDTFEFDVVSNQPLNTSEIALIEKNAALYLERGLQIIINQVPAIQRPASGKIKHFYSEIGNNEVPPH